MGPGGYVAICTDASFRALYSVRFGLCLEQGLCSWDCWVRVGGCNVGPVPLSANLGVKLRFDSGLELLSYLGQ